MELQLKSPTLRGFITRHRPVGSQSEEVVADLPQPLSPYGPAKPGVGGDKGGPNLAEPLAQSLLAQFFTGSSVWAGPDPVHYYWFWGGGHRSEFLTREESYTRQHLFVQVAESNGLLQNMSLTCNRYTNLQKQTAG